MELTTNNMDWPDSLPSKRIKFIQHLTQGQQLTNNLRKMLQFSKNNVSNFSSIDDVIVQILGMFDKTLLILSSCTFKEISPIQINDIRSPRNSDGQKEEEHTIEHVEDVKLKPNRGCYKRRKTSWTSTKVTSTLVDDGYAWRKYGQKEILNTKYQRNYYRCSHKFDQGCTATKQVQKTEDEPPKYKIIYNGQHTCNNLRNPQTIMDSSNPKDKTIIFNFEIQGSTKTKHDDLSQGLTQASSLDHCLSWNLTK